MISKNVLKYEHFVNKLKNTEKHNLFRLRFWGVGTKGERSFTKRISGRAENKTERMM